MLVLLLGLVAVASSSNVKMYHNHDDPKADHTTAAIKFDQQGQPNWSLQAFAAAAKFTPTVNTVNNLGVAKMRQNMLDEAPFVVYFPGEPTP
jgi:hypothetical protein